MTDTERLNLIEHYKWSIMFSRNVVLITGDDCIFARSGKTLREAVDNALKAQFEWSVGK